MTVFPSYPTPSSLLGIPSWSHKAGAWGPRKCTHDRRSWLTRSPSSGSHSEVSEYRQTLELLVTNIVKTNWALKKPTATTIKQDITLLYSVNTINTFSDQGLSPQCYHIYSVSCFPWDKRRLKCLGMLYLTFLHSMMSTTTAITAITSKATMAAVIATWEFNTAREKNKWLHKNYCVPV